MRASASSICCMSPACGTRFAGNGPASSSLYCPSLPGSSRKATESARARPSAVTPMAAMASSFKRCRDCRSTSESVLSPPGWVWMQRTPERRASERRLWTSGRPTVSASPMVTSSTLPLRER